MAVKRILILNGPNLNLVGVREPSIYGAASLDDYLTGLIDVFPNTQLLVEQTNHEGALIDALHVHGFTVDGVVLNPGGYTHTSIALRDAISAISAPVVEVHLSNIYAREDFRRQSLTAPACKAVISGLGLEGYAAAVRYLIQLP